MQWVKKSKSAKINSLKVHGKDISDPTANAKEFQFKPILPNELMRPIQKQNNNRVGNIPTRFLKDAASCVHVSPSLSVVFSKSLEQGKYPDNLKLARIRAIYKGKDSKSNSDSFRPISVLSAVPGSLKS